MTEIINKHSRMPRKLSRLTLRRREKEATGGPHQLAECNPHAILARYIGGEKIREIAKEYGVSRVAMYSFLMRNVHAEWIEAQRGRAIANKEMYEEDLEESTNPIEIAKARELLRAAQWDLERVDRKTYGRDEQTININVTDLGDRLRRSRERILESNVTNTQLLEQKTSNAPSSDYAGGREKREQIQAAELVPADA